MKKNRFVLLKYTIFAKWFLRNGCVKKSRRYMFFDIIGKKAYKQVQKPYWRSYIIFSTKLKETIFIVSGMHT